MGFLVFPLILILGYFLLVRPQQSQARQARALVQNLQLGCEVQTAGGIVGRVVDLDDQYVQLQCGPGTTITFVRTAVAKLLSAPEDPTPASEGSEAPFSAGTGSPGVFLPDSDALDLPPTAPPAPPSDPRPDPEDGAGAP